MRKNILLLLFYLIALTCYSSNNNEQKINIISLSGKKEYIFVKFNYVKNQIKISNDKNEMNLCDFTDLITMKVFSDRYLYLHYKVFGGNGVKIEKTVLLCVDEGNIYNTFDVYSKIINFGKPEYSLIIKQIIKRNNTWLIKITEQNVHKKQEFNLKFNDKIKIFYFDKIMSTHERFESTLKKGSKKDCLYYHFKTFNFNYIYDNGWYYMTKYDKTFVKLEDCL